MERSRGVDIPRAQQNCPTPKIRKVTARAVCEKKWKFFLTETYWDIVNINRKSSFFESFQF